MEEERPREKMVQRGIDSLTDAELLGILISTGSKDISAVGLARMILNQTGGLNSLAGTSIATLMNIKGVGAAKASTISAAFELSRRRATEVQRYIKIHGSDSAANYLSPILRDQQQEMLYILFLTRNNRIRGEKSISKGGTSSTIVDIKLIFKEAVNHLASGIIMAHNHPSGSLTPSEADKHITEKVKETGKIMDIPLLDHIIIAPDGHFSFSASGML